MEAVLKERAREQGASRLTVPAANTRQRGRGQVREDKLDWGCTQEQGQLLHSGQGAGYEGVEVRKGTKDDSQLPPHTRPAFTTTPHAIYTIRK